MAGTGALLRALPTVQCAAGASGADAGAEGRRGGQPRQAAAGAPERLRLRRAARGRAGHMCAAAGGPPSPTPSFSSFASVLEAKPAGGEGAAPAAAAAAALPIGEVPLESEMDVDYTVLRDRLAAGEWELADNETRRLMCELAGEEAQLREWVYFTEVKFMPVKDLQTVDALWRSYSRDRYGFTIQRQLWVAGRRQWGPLFKRISWVTGENNAYRKWPGEFLWQEDAPKGHLPLTNCLRGTQLFQALLEHPAFGGPTEKREPQVWQSSGKTSWLSAAGVNKYSGEPPTLGLGLVVQVAAALLLAAISAGLQPNQF